MNTEIFSTKQEMGKAAAAHGISTNYSISSSGLTTCALRAKGSASFIVATGASQFETLAELAKADLPWNKLTGFHLDEPNAGLPVHHDASFRKYLWERFREQAAAPARGLSFS